MDSLVNISGVTGPKLPAEQRTHPQRSKTDSARPADGDTLEISTRAAELTNLADARLKRTQRVGDIRDRIAAGTYVNEHKINVTVEKLFAKLSALDLQA